MKNNITLFGIITLCCCSLSAFSTEDMHPPITKETINGVWEASSGRSIRVFRLDINTKGRSYLSYACPNLDAQIYEMTELSIKGEAIVMKFKKKGGASILEIKGHGISGIDGGKNEGILHAVLNMNPGGEYDNLWKLEFSKYWTISELNKLAEKAKAVIEREKSD